MSGRQQLFLFVLGLVSISLCVTGVAMAFDTMRRMNSPAAVVAQEQVFQPTATPGMAWNPPPATDTPPPPPSPTNTLVPTWTPQVTDTPTPLPSPTDTLTPAPPIIVNTAPPPVVATNTPIPEPPTPEISYKYNAAAVTFPTGTDQMTYITGMAWNVIDLNTNHFDGQPDYQMKVIDPTGGEHMSDVSGLGYADSRCLGCGDNRHMNMKVEFTPYIPGVYHISLWQAWDGAQASNEIEVTLNAGPQDYVHVDFFPN